MFGNLIIRFVTLAVLWVAYVQSKSQSGTNDCLSRTTCHECIQTEFCAWCAKPDLNEKRCFYAPDPNNDCPEEYFFYPMNIFNIVQNRNLSSTINSASILSQSTMSEHGSDEKHEAVQIAPQEVNVKVKINQAQRVQFSFSQAEDYPVDLYYLMDLSKSMEDDKKKLSDLGDRLVREMSNLTSKFRLGFGSFVDKVTMPYVSTAPLKLLDPCGGGCAAPYGYKHIMDLSQNTSLFVGLVKDAPVSGNLDGPEGGFDALMQAVVCKNEIGWRDKARRLLVFSTDATFHYAGDGKLGGIVKPNDGMCHLDENGMYSHSLLQDYPSISQINQKVKQNAINIIWAVTREEIGTYSRLCAHIEGSSAGELSNDSSNIVELIKNQYNQIRSTVEIKDTVSSNAIKIKYMSRCLDGNEVETTKCDKLKKGDKVDFSAYITVTHCPANRSEWIQNFTIYPVGINETLKINLEMICECDCERPDNPSFIENSPHCNNNGTYKCGVCECNTGSFGKKCECNTSAYDHNKNFQNCRSDNTSLLDCSGRGECSCGTCECSQTHLGDNLKIWGDYCECDNFSCDRRENKFCSGHGKCGCKGICECEDGWTGKACECRSTTDTCIEPGTVEPCSGKGTCKCGQCECNVEDGVRYSGTYCQKCATCQSQCFKLEPCVLCQVYSKISNLTEEECTANCTGIEIQRVETIDKTLIKEDENLCQYKDSEDCVYFFIYYSNVTKLFIQAQNQPECPPEIYLLGIVMAVIAGVVLMGLTILFIWKLLTTIHDRREYAKFEKERMMAKWDTGENPIYKQATSTFTNPTYGGKR